MSADSCSVRQFQFIVGFGDVEFCRFYILALLVEMTLCGGDRRRKVFLIFLEDIPGEDVKKLLLEASIHVETGGLKGAPWRKDMVSAMFVESKIAWAIYFTSVAFFSEGKIDAAVGWFRSVNHI